MLKITTDSLFSVSRIFEWKSFKIFLNYFIFPLKKKQVTQQIFVIKFWSTAICKWWVKNFLANLTPWPSRKARRSGISSTTPFCACSTSDAWRRSKSDGGLITRRKKNAATPTINRTAFPFKTLVRLFYFIFFFWIFQLIFCFKINIGGVFIVIFVGIFLACVTLAVEYCYFKVRRNPEGDEVVSTPESRNNATSNRNKLVTSTLFYLQFEYLLLFSKS